VLITHFINTIISTAKQHDNLRALMPHPFNATQLKTTSIVFYTIKGGFFV